MVLDHCIFVGAKTLNCKVIPIIYLNFSSICIIWVGPEPVPTLSSSLINHCYQDLNFVTWRSARALSRKKILI